MCYATLAMHAVYAALLYSTSMMAALQHHVARDKLCTDDALLLWQLGLSLRASIAPPAGLALQLPLVLYNSRGPCQPCQTLSVPETPFQQAAALLPAIPITVAALSCCRIALLLAQPPFMLALTFTIRRLTGKGNL
jgi:hypothetical protein